MSYLLSVIFGLAFLIAPTYFIKFILRRVGLKLNRLELGFLSLFLGQIFLVSFIFLLSILFGLSKILIIISLIIFFIIDFLIALNNKFNFKINCNFKGHEKVFLIAILITGIFFLFLLQRHMLPESIDGLSTPHNTFGDIQYHLAMINSFSLGKNFPPQNPIYAGVRLSYPFMIDFYSAVFRTVDLNLQYSLIIPGLIFGICFFSFFILFAYRFLKSGIGALISLLIFAFNGGLGGYLVLKEAIFSSNFSRALPEKFSSVIDKYNFRFPNGISSVFMAERPILVGMSAFFLILILFWLSFEKEKADRELGLAGLIIGLLPLWHTHTLIALGLVLPFYVVCYWIYNKVSFKRVLRFIAPIFYFSIPLGFLGILWHIPQVFGGGVHFFSLKTGWVVGSEGFWKFWLINLGIFPVLILFAFLFLNKIQKLFYLSVLSIPFIANFVNFQPFAWDNYKILLIWYAVSSIAVAKLVSFLLMKRNIGKIAAIGIILFSTISGAVLIVGDYLTYYGLFSKEDIELSNWEIMNTKPTDLILTGPQHDQFSILAGRKILMGYPGYLWTQGIDSGHRGNDIKKMYHGDMNLIKNYGVKFIVLGYEEKNSYHPDEKFLDSNFILVKQTENFKIYKVI